MTSRDLTSFIHRAARDCGIPLLGITGAEPLIEEGAALTRWIEAGDHGDMQWMADTAALRARPGDVMPGTKSILVALWPHHPPVRHIPQGYGRVAAYGYGRDYHKVLKKRLLDLCRRIDQQEPGARTRAFVDTGPVLERSLARRAGLGFIGRNRALITPAFGSWCFIGVVLTSLDLQPTAAPPTDACDGCRKCIDACPTGALTQNGFDARRCISYLTIEYKGVIGKDLANRMGDRLFGCDTCQRVCPYNDGVDTGAESWSDTGHHGLKLTEVLNWRDADDVLRNLAGTAIRRPGRGGLVRNACIAVANTGAADTLPLLRRLAANDADDVVRRQARQALDTLGEPGPPPPV